jgi:type II secretory pathway component GspD/PulD (secretin)
MAEIRTTTEEYHYISGYNEPNNPSDEPEPKLDKVDLGTNLWLTPKLTDDNRNINLDLKLELRQLKGIIEGKYKEKYPYFKPIVDVISSKMLCTIPDGKTMLIGGLKIIEPIIKEPGTPGLKDLPLIGAAFGSKDKTKVHKMLLILVKPVPNPQQKATKILPGQEDSEEHIKGLAEQLEKKINPPGKPE